MPEPPPRRRAAALHYEAGDVAPRVTAAGSGLIAERIIAAAREAGVPVREDPALVRALAALDLGEAVPEPLWRAVAEALAWAYKLDAEVARRRAV
ncbi:MAG TPA: EscU/YscU/HrcU family type III secretion system export apparatus switch protein [Solirubrobacteraceae bacterium]|jgi:flagellar biosynthesis protein|nr:EscU/YscU/HrcU family type III secretion system export apparatus switch protein [Solirubrobacteraceae bacterium]